MHQASSGATAAGRRDAAAGAREIWDATKDCSRNREGLRGAGVFNVMRAEDIWVIAAAVACITALMSMAIVVLW
jgi:hypothetical protein